MSIWILRSAARAGIFGFSLGFALFLAASEGRAEEAAPIGAAVLGNAVQNHTQAPEGGPATEKPLNLKISPELSVALPQPLSLGVELARAEDLRFRGFASLGYIVVPLSSGTRTVNLFTIQAGVRYFPWQKGFYGALGLGYRHAGLKADTSAFSIDGQVLATDGSIDLYTMFAGFSLGAEFALSRRWSLGFDLGAQLPILAHGKMNLSDSSTGLDSSNSDLLAVGDSSSMTRIARLIVPQLTLVRLSWSFD